MARALITGITGQTGSYLAEELAALGWEVHGLVRPTDDARQALAQIAPTAQLHEGDLEDMAGLAELIDRLEPTTVFNLGGLSSVGQSWQNPIATARITGLPIAGILDAALRLQDRIGDPVTVVQASSAEIFGRAEHAPQSETTPLRPTNPYGAAKTFAHVLTGVYRERGLSTASCILYNHESPRRPPTFVTRKITRAAARISLGLQSTVTLGNLDARRDWGWAPDYARALAAAATITGDYVIATGVAHTVRDFVEAAFVAAGVPDWENRIEVDPALIRAGDAAEQVGDATKARRELDWSPTKDFAAIVGAMVEADLAEAAAQG